MPGYNPYRRGDNGQFTTKAQAGAVVEKDYNDAIAAGDTARASEIATFAVNELPESKISQQILQQAYGSTATVSKRSEHAIDTARHDNTATSFGPQGQYVEALLDEQAQYQNEEQQHALRDAWRDASPQLNQVYDVAEVAIERSGREYAWNAVGLAAENFAGWESLDAVRDAAQAVVIRDLITDEQFHQLAGPYESHPQSSDSVMECSDICITQRRRSMAVISKACHLRIRKSYEYCGKDIVEIPTEDATKAFDHLIDWVHDEVTKRLALYDAWNIVRALDHARDAREEQTNHPVSLKPAEEARQAGIRFTIPSGTLASSRVEKLAQDQLVSKLKRWDRTPKHLPAAGYSINLGAVDHQMRSLVCKGNSIWLDAKIWDKHLLLAFNVPKHLRNAVKICSPNVSLRGGKVIFSFAFQYNAPRPQISADYVLGVDRGVVELGSWSVVDAHTHQPVADGFLSDRACYIAAKIGRITAELPGIYAAMDGAIVCHDLDRYQRLHNQLTGKRNRLTILKEQLCIQAAQEIVAISQIYDNTMIMLEDLSWSGNWHGRVPFGLFRHWVGHYAEQVGTHVQYVNAAYTSQICSRCGWQRTAPLRGRTFICDNCCAQINRDLNAAANIASRGAVRAIKSAATRKKRTTTRRRPKVLRHKTLTINVKNGYAGAGASMLHRVASGLGNNAPVRGKVIRRSRITIKYRL